MADDKNIKTPDIPATDTGPEIGQPQASKAEPEKQEPKAAPLPEADKKPEPEAAAPNVSVYNFSEIMKGKKVEERAAHAPEKSSPTPPEKETVKETEKLAAPGKSENAPTKEVAKADIPSKAEKTAEKQEPPKRRGRPPKETAPKKEPAQKTGKAPVQKKAEKESEVKKEPLKKEVSKETVSAAPPEKTAGKAPEKPKGAPRRGKEQIVYIKLDDLHAFKNHPFEVRDDEEMRAMVSSVKDKGVTQPAIVRPREDGGYEIVSGHRRQKASELAGYADMPCIVRNLTDDEAITQMVEDNLNQREEILPSERAKALKMQLEAIKHQGSRTSGQIDPKDAGKRSNEIVAERNKMAVKQVQRYIRLNELVPDLMKLMDEKKLGFTTAVELSYISKKNQNYIAVAVDSQQSSPSQAQAKRMRELDEKKLLNGDVIDGIMMEDKKEVAASFETGRPLPIVHPFQCFRMRGASKRQEKEAFRNSFGLPTDPFPTLLASDVTPFSFWYEGDPGGGCVRFLTETESERLMGLPEGWTKYGADGGEIRSSFRYRALGNAIALPCADYIMGGIYEVLAGQTGKEG